MGNRKMIHLAGRVETAEQVPQWNLISRMARAEYVTDVWQRVEDDGTFSFACCLETDAQTGACVRELGKAPGMLMMGCAVLDLESSDWRLHCYQLGRWVQTLVYEPRRELRSEPPLTEADGSDEDRELVLAWKAWAEARPVPPDAGGDAYRAWRAAEPRRGPTEHGSDPGMPTGAPGAD